MRENLRFSLIAGYARCSCPRCLDSLNAFAWPRLVGVRGQSHGRAKPGQLCHVGYKREPPVPSHRAAAPLCSLSRCLDSLNALAWPPLGAVGDQVMAGLSPANPAELVRVMRGCAALLTFPLSGFIVCFRPAVVERRWGPSHGRANPGQPCLVGVYLALEAK